MPSNLAPNSFLTNGHAACKSWLKPKPPDLCQIRGTRLWYCFGAISPWMRSGRLQFKHRRHLSRRVCQILDVSLSYCLLYLLRATLWSRQTQTWRLHTAAFVEERNSSRARFTGDTYLQMSKPEVTFALKASSSHVVFVFSLHHTDEKLNTSKISLVQDKELKSTLVKKRGDNLTGGDRFSALFIMLQWAYPIITAW